MTDQNINNENKPPRPLSPHLSIYKPQISSVLSIAHRATGFVLYFGLVLLVWAFFFKVYYPDSLFFENEFFRSYIWKFFLFGLNFCLFYHLLNGIRHLFWDMGLGFSLKAVNFSGILVVILSIGLTITAWALAFPQLIKWGF